MTYTSWPNTMTIELCNSCTQAALLPVGIYTCLSNSLTLNNQCSAHVAGTPKLLTHADLVVLNNTTSKIKTKECKEPIKSEVRVEKPVEKETEQPVAKKTEAKKQKLNSQVSMF